MNTIHCRLKQNEYQEIGKRHVTPAEALILRAIHDPAAHRFASQATTPEEVANFWKCIVNPVASGEAEHIQRDEEMKEIARHKRTNAEELARLRHAYPTKSKTNPLLHIIEELFPGMNPKLPETFQEIGLVVASPDAERPTARKGHGPEMAEKTGQENVVSYDASPKEPKAPKAAKEPKAPKAAKEPAPTDASE